MEQESPSLPTPQPAPRIDLLERVGAGIEVILVAVAGLLVLPFFFAWWDVGPAGVMQRADYVVTLMVADATVTLLLIALMQKARGQSWSVLGWDFSNVRSRVLTGVFAVPFLFGTVFLVRLFFEYFLPQYASETNPLLELIDSEVALGLFLFSSIYVGGFKEEVQRAFVLERFRKYLGGPWLGLVLWSLFFGYGHAVQGVDNAVGAGLLGVLFGILYLWRRNLVAPIVAHALYDITTLVLYWTLWDLSF